MPDSGAGVSGGAVSAEKHADGREIRKLDPDKAGFFISEGGPLSKISGTFEERKVQISLLKSIVNVMNDGKIGVFEAGTGVGKSYSYLIPSALWALENRQKVVVSTGTINLQQQLCSKDIPAVERILGRKISYILMKGRQNYVCLRRMNEAAAVRELFEENSEEFDSVIEWAKNSGTGSRSELSFMPSENVWSRINSESDACMGIRCPYHDDCFVMKVRKQAAGADIIVVNHHLFFADIESRMGGAGYDDAAVLPPYRRVIFDEAHGIEGAATSFFSESLSRFRLYKFMNLMYRKRRNSEVGHICTLAVISSAEDEVSGMFGLTEQIRNSVSRLELAAGDLLGQEHTMRLCAATARDFGPLLSCVSELSSALGEFTGLVRRVMDGIDEDDRNVPSYWESKVIVRRLEEYLMLLRSFTVWDERSDSVFWIQRKRLPPDMVRQGTSADYMVLTRTPLDISSFMNEGVFSRMDSVVCTSATIKAGRDFRYWMGRTGLLFCDGDRIVCGEYPSPFPYSSNMMLAVPSDAPLPDRMEFQQYVETAVPRLIRAAEGRTLVLFTSYESLKSTFSAAVSALPGFSGLLMRQGEDDSGRLLARFKEEKESVLFATDSFWQGVDIPGESLSQVVIVKLPFSVPNDPVFTARSEAITMRGGSSFMELSLPEAVIKFRQGTGRLIRRSDDRGVVTVLDRRLYEKRYGSIFLAGIPECCRVYKPLGELVSDIGSFIFR